MAVAERARPGEKPQPLREIVQPFVDLARAPRALWGVNLNYLVEGFVYFGMVIYLAMYFNEYVALDDQRAGWMVGALTSAISSTVFLVLGRNWVGRIVERLRLPTEEEHDRAPHAPGRRPPRWTAANSRNEPRCTARSRRAPRTPWNSAARAG